MFCDKCLQEDTASVQGSGSHYFLHITSMVLFPYEASAAFTAAVSIHCSIKYMWRNESVCMLWRNGVMSSTHPVSPL